MVQRVLFTRSVFNTCYQNYLPSQNAALYSSMYSTNSPPALAHPVIPSSNIKLSILLSPIWSLNHPAARVPRPREDADSSQLASLDSTLLVFGTPIRNLQQYQMTFWTPADLKRLYNVGMAG